MILKHAPVKSCGSLPSQFVSDRVFVYSTGILLPGEKKNEGGKRKMVIVRISGGIVARRI